MMTLDQDDLIGPPTEPDLGPPLPGKSYGKVPTITPGGEVATTVTNASADAKPDDAQARALHRAIHAKRNPWSY